MTALIPDLTVDEPAELPAVESGSRDTPEHIGIHRDKRRRFVLLDELCARPPARSWNVRRYLEPNTIAVLYGDSDAFKSFIAIDLLCHSAHGVRWRGNRTQPGFCLYIAGEGGDGISKRFKAWHEHHGIALHDHIAVSTVPLELCDPANAADLIEDIQELLDEKQQRASIIVIDTLSAHFGNGDESKTADMRAFTGSIRKLRIATGATVIVIHHVGHGNKDRERGAYSLRGDADWRYQLERTDGTGITTLKCVKARDAEKPEALSWNLVPVRLPWREEGDEDGTSVPMTSLVPLPVESPTETPKPERLSPAQRIALSALGTALMNHGVEEGGVVSVADDLWRKAAYDAGVSVSDKQDTRKKAFNRCKDELLAAGKVRGREGRYWIPKPTGTYRDISGQCPVLSPGHDEGHRDITGHIPLGMSRCVPFPDDPTQEEGTDFGRCGKEEV